LNEISEILDTSPNTIKSRITRGKEKIKKYYRGGVENETAER
jgi:DNA-directed RNA polymerase specialized sigma24 family protein